MYLYNDRLISSVNILSKYTVYNIIYLYVHLSVY